MKKGALLCVALLLLAFFLTGTAVADDVTKNLQSEVLEDFDGPDSSWIVLGSKFTTEGYPVSKYINTWPEALYARQSSGDTTRLKALGVHVKWNRTGYNYVELIPAKKGADGRQVATPIAIPGRVQNIDFWVWGSNHDYYLECHLIDHRGIIHVIKVGDLRFVGWRNMRIDIPTYIPQSVNYAPRYRGLSLFKLVVWTKPNEKVDDFWIYFDQIKVITDRFESPFDGTELADPTRVQQLWGTPQPGAR